MCQLCYTIISFPNRIDSSEGNGTQCQDKENDSKDNESVSNLSIDNTTTHDMALQNSNQNFEQNMDNYKEYILPYGWKKVGHQKRSHI